MIGAPSEIFPALANIDSVRHAFLQRVPGLDVSIDREAALALLAAHHAAARDALGFSGMRFVTASQVHGCEVAAADDARDACIDGADALITDRAKICLGIYVADCAPVYLVDPGRAIGLIHSGKKGTELGIAARTIRQMCERFGSRPESLIAQIGPCIRPPHYEIDFAAEIAAQCRAAGVREVFDCGKDTAADSAAYYSYRMDKGRTGRMLALLALL